jgi:hypothetical protein
MKTGDMATVIENADIAGLTLNYDATIPLRPQSASNLMQAVKQIPWFSSSQPRALESGWSWD